MRRVTITRNTVAGKRPVFAGETHNLHDEDARILVIMGKAKPAKVVRPKAKKPKAPEKKAGLTTKTAAAVVRKGKKT